MKGKITNFKAEKGFGFIVGEDNQKYFFHISTVSNPMDIEEGYSVDFKTKEDGKGLSAINITVQAPLSDGRSKDKLLKIKEVPSKKVWVTFNLNLPKFTINKRKVQLSS